MSIKVRVQIRTFGRIIVFIGVTTLLAVGGFFVQSNLFKIETIEVKASGVSLVLNEKNITNNLLFFPAQKIRQILLRENVFLADVRFIKKYPHTLIIEPILREPIARLTTQAGVVFLDKTGVVLPSNLNQTLPVLMFDVGAVHEGQTLNDARIVQSLKFIEHMGATEVIRSITMRDGSSIVANIHETDILFTQDAPIETIVATLQTLLTGFRIKGSLPKSIDLRFDKPIVTF